MAQDTSGGRGARSLRDAVAEVAPDIDGRATGATPVRGSAPPPLPGPAKTETPTEKAAAPAATESTSSPKLLPPPPAATLSADAKPAETPPPPPIAPPGQRRRAAGPAREGVIAANDDAPTIGALIYALNQKPSRKPFMIAAALSGMWVVLGLAFGWAMIAAELARGGGFTDLVARPVVLTVLATVVLPIALFWFLAWLLYQAQDLRLRSSAMTEVAIRLAEPDRHAEQAVASLGQTVRKQINYLNEAVSQAIGRAGELEAMVHNEVASLDQSFAANEARIRALLDKLASHRGELTGTSEQVHATLRAMGDEVPALIEKLNSQQLKLSRIIETAGENLIALEGKLLTASGTLETTVGERTTALTGVLESAQVNIAGALESGHANIAGALTSTATHLQTVLDEYASAVNVSLGARTEQLQTVFEQFTLAIDQTLATRNDNMNQALTAQVDAFDGRLLERTQAIDSALATRLINFDDAVRNSTAAIDGALGEKARALSAAMETHARQLADTLSRQSQNLDETLIQGISAVRRTSENITRQSVKAIEGLSGQADMLKNVSENLLGQINSVTSRFENQGQSILRAANSLEQANYRIDQTLQSRHRDLSETLTRLTDSSEQIGQQMVTYKTTIEGSMTDAQARAKALTDDLARGAQTHAQLALSELQRLRTETDQQATAALDTLRQQVSGVSREVGDHMSSLSSRLAQTSDDLRTRAQLAASDLEREQQRLRAEAERLPQLTRESAEQMRRSLNDQMRALERVSSLANRDGRDITPPAAPRSLAAPPTLSEALASELQRAPTPQPAASPTNWRLSDVLARASKDEASIAHVPVAQPSSGQFNLDQIATALDIQTAGAIWARLRTGQRGVLVRSIYSAEGRQVFDEVQRRFASDMDFRGMVDRFLADFERVLRDAEARDGTGQLLQGHLVSSSGRIYLFLAHASGRLS